MRKDDCRNSARRTQASVITILFVPAVRRKQAKEKRQDIHKKVQQPAFCFKNTYEICLYTTAKEIKRIHVKGQMHEIRMYQPAGKKAVPLPVMRNGRGIKDQVIQYFFIVESTEGNYTGNNDDN